MSDEQEIICRDCQGDIDRGVVVLCATHAIAELKVKDMLKVNANHVLEQASLRAKLAEITKKRNDAESEGSRLVSLLERLEDSHEETKKEAESYAEDAGRMQEERDRAVQCLINVQDYLRSVGRNFPAAQVIIDKWKEETA